MQFSFFILILTVTQHVFNHYSDIYNNCDCYDTLKWGETNLKMLMYIRVGKYLENDFEYGKD